MAREHYHEIQARVAETTAQIYMRALKAFFNWDVREKMCRANPFNGMRLAKIKQAARVIYRTREQRP